LFSLQFHLDASFIDFIGRYARMFNSNVGLAHIVHHMTHSELST